MKGSEFETWIVHPVLVDLGTVEPRMATPASCNLILGTWAQESDGGRWLDQTLPGPGPAYGMLQQEEPSFRDVTNWLATHDEMMKIAKRWLLPGKPEIEHLHGNLYMDVLYCRIYYWLDRLPLPDPRNVDALAHYWKRRWNTVNGDGTVGQFVNRWHLYVGKGHAT